MNGGRCSRASAEVRWRDDAPLEVAPYRLSLSSEACLVSRATDEPERMGGERGEGRAGFRGFDAAARSVSPVAAEIAASPCKPSPPRDIVAAPCRILCSFAIVVIVWTQKARSPFGGY